MSHDTPYGIVVIGRNEGSRLIRCFKSLKIQVPDTIPVVYVDSGSTDGSLEAAKSFNFYGIELDKSNPFTMARGRNEGFQFLLKNHAVDYIQFIDGDCELLEGWIEKALATFTEADQSLAIVCGRRYEKYPEKSIYNRLVDIEWNKPKGEIKACGGDALVKVKALQEVGGYNENLICGEEPEMCIRLRKKGWKIVYIDQSMTLHDASILTFSQWWKRSVRAGWAGAQGLLMYGLPPESYKVKECLGCWLWGIFFHVALVITLIFFTQYTTILIGLYLIRVTKIFYKKQIEISSYRISIYYTCFSLLINYPHVIGQLKFWYSLLTRKKIALIEYKSTTAE